MPITSYQAGSMIAGQQAAFGNFASYAQQISPGGGLGIQPAYHNPMQGGGRAFQPPAPPNTEEMQMGMNMGPAALSAAGNVGLPMLGTAAMMGSFLPGRVGGAFSMMDPTMAAMKGFGAGSGIGFGGHGFLSGAGWKSFGSGLGNVLSGGIGGIARAGIAGLGGAALAAAPMMAIGGAAQYVGGQMVEGAQFQNQVHGALQNQFRFLNPQSATGFGFSREQTSGIADMVRKMGHSDMMTSPQELLNVMKQGVGSGYFKAVQDANEFKTKFKDMVKALKSVSEAFSTTLEGAMPFFQESRKMGFWTPQDVMRNAQMVRQTAGTTGMSVAQTQGMMSQGAAMARQVGALGATGATGMAGALNLVGGGLRSGVLTEQGIAEATGLTGKEGMQAFAGKMQAENTRFASGRIGRWMLAALGGQGFKGLDAGRMQQMMSGGMSIGDISRLARQNIGREGAFSFVMNEQRLRGELLQRPELQAGFVKTLVGGRLYGDSDRDKYIVRRMIQRHFGGSAAEADQKAELARNLPKIMEDNQARTGAVLDQQDRERERMMEGSYEGLKRKISSWWDKNVKEPLQSVGASLSKSVGDWWERKTDQFWGRAPRGFRLAGITQEVTRGMHQMALGNAGAAEELFGQRGNLQRALAGTGGGGDQNASVASLAGIGSYGRGGLASLLPSTSLMQSDVRRLNLFAASGTWVSKDSGAKALQQAEVKASRQIAAAQGGIAGLSNEAAKELGFDSLEGARKALGAAQKEMSDSSFMRASQQIRKELGENAGAMARGARMVNMIRQGRLGGEALRAVVGEARDVSMGDAVRRLAAAQTGEQRRGFGGLDFGKELEQLGGVDLRGKAETITARLTTKQEDLSWQLAHYVSGAGQGFRSPGERRSMKEGPQKAFMSLMQSPQAGTVRQALRLMNSGTTQEERATNKQRALSLLTKAANDPDLKEDQRNVLMKMADPKDPDRAGLDKIMSQMGAVDQAMQQVSAKDVIDRRMKRMEASMASTTEERERMLMKMDELKMGGGQGFGSTLKALMDSKYTGPQEFQQKLEEITRMAAEAKGEDKERVAGIIQQLEGVSGAETIVTSLRGGQGLQQAAGRLTGGGRFTGKQSAGDINEIMRGLTRGGASITTDELKKLGGKDADKVQERILNRISDSTEKANVQQLLEGVRQGGPEGLQKVLETGRRGVMARALGQLSDKDKDIMNQMKNLKPGEVIGELGSQKGIHAELAKHTAKFQELIDAVKESGGATGNKKEEAGK